MLLLACWWRIMDALLATAEACLLPAAIGVPLVYFDVVSASWVGLALLVFSAARLLFALLPPKKDPELEAFVAGVLKGRGLEGSDAARLFAPMLLRALRIRRQSELLARGAAAAERCAAESGTLDEAAGEVAGAGAAGLMAEMRAAVAHNAVRSLARRMGRADLETLADEIALPPK